MAQTSTAVDDAAGRYALSLDAVGANVNSKIAYSPPVKERDALARLLGVEKTAAEVTREHVFLVEDAPIYPHRFARVVALQRFDGLRWLGVDVVDAAKGEFKLNCPSMATMLEDLREKAAGDVPGTIAELFSKSKFSFDPSAMRWAIELHKNGSVPGMKPEVIRSTVLNTVTVNDSIATSYDSTLESKGEDAFVTTKATEYNKFCVERDNATLQKCEECRTLGLSVLDLREIAIVSAKLANKRTAPGQSDNPSDPIVAPTSSGAVEALFSIDKTKGSTFAPASFVGTCRYYPELISVLGTPLVSAGYGDLDFGRATKDGYAPLRNNVHGHGEAGVKFRLLRSNASLDYAMEGLPTSQEAGEEALFKEYREFVQGTAAVDAVRLPSLFNVVKAFAQRQDTGNKSIADAIPGPFRLRMWANHEYAPWRRFAGTIKQLSELEFDKLHKELTRQPAPTKQSQAEPGGYEPSDHTVVFLAPLLSTLVGDDGASKADDRVAYATPINGRRTLMRIPPTCSDGDVTVRRIVECAARAIRIVGRPENAKFKHYLNIGAERRLGYKQTTQRAMNDIDRVVRELVDNRPALVSAGPMKSLLQKLIRAGNPLVSFWGDGVGSDGANATLTWVAAMVVFGFNAMDSKCSAVLPEQNMQRVRGQTSALKRLGVVLLEDAWPQALPVGFPTADVCMETLLALASVTANDELGYHVNDDVLTFGMLVAASAVSSSFSVPSACTKSGEKRLKYAQHLAFDLVDKLEVGAKAGLVSTHGRLIDDVRKLTRDIRAVEAAATVRDADGNLVRRYEDAALENMRAKTLAAELQKRREQLDGVTNELARVFAEFEALNEPYQHDRSRAVQKDLFTQEAVSKYVLTSMARSQFQPALYNSFGDMLVRVHVASMQRASAFLRHTNSLGSDKLMFERAATLSTPLTPTGLLHNPLGNGRVAGLAMVYSPMICAPGELLQLDAPPAQRITHMVPHATQLSGSTATVPRTLASAGVWNRVAQTDEELERSVKAKFSEYQVLSALRLARPGRMPLPAIHMVDQHAYRAIGHMMQEHPYNSDDYKRRRETDELVPDSFQSRFETIFRTTTGFNPRIQLESLHELSSVVRLVRHAQTCQMTALLEPRVSTRLAPRPPGAPTASKKLRVSLAPSLLGGGVGAQGAKPTTQHLSVKGSVDASGKQPTVQCVVTIGTLDSPELVVFAKPSANSATKTQELGTSVKKAAEEAYLLIASTTGLQFKDGMLKDYTRATFRPDQGWFLEPADKKSGSELRWTRFNEAGEHVFAYENHFVEAACTPMAVEDLDPRTDRLRDLIARADARYAVPDASEGDEEVRDAMDEALCDANTAVERLSRLVLAPLQEAAVRGKLNARMLAERLLALANGAVNDTFELPLPNKDGGRAADKLEAVRGDWHIYRALLVLCALAPGALSRRRNAQASFRVKNRPLFRYTIDALTRAVRAFAWQSASAPPASSSAMIVGGAADAPPPVSSWQEVLQRFGDRSSDPANPAEAAEMDVDQGPNASAAPSEPPAACTLLPHQTAALQTMMRREGFVLEYADANCMAGVPHTDTTTTFKFSVSREDARGAAASVGSATPRAQMVSFATGLGKTIVAALYALLWSHATGSATHILWLCPSGARNGTIRELHKWGFGAHVHEVKPKTDKGAKSKARRKETRVSLRKHAINIIDFDDLSSSNAELAQVEQRGAGVEDALQSRLVAIASSSFVVVDEMHELYNPAIKTSVARAIASSAVKYVAVTATPTPKSNAAAVALAWLQDTVTFPINVEDKTFPHNRLTALATAIQTTVQIKTTVNPVNVATNDVRTVGVALRSPQRLTYYESDLGLELGTSKWDEEYLNLCRRLVPHYALLSVGYGLEDRVERIKEAHRIHQAATSGSVDPLTANRALRNLTNQQHSSTPTNLVATEWSEAVWSKVTGGALLFVPSSIVREVRLHCEFLLWWLSGQCRFAVQLKPHLSFTSIANGFSTYNEKQRDMARALLNACADLYDPKAMRHNVGLVPDYEDDVRILRKYFIVPGLNDGGSDLFVRGQGYVEFKGREEYREQALRTQDIDPVTDDVEIAYDILLKTTPNTAFVAVARDAKNSHPQQDEQPPTPDHTADAGVVIQSTHHVSSFNFQHMSACVFGVFPSSIAQRHQLLGRVLRLGQERRTVVYKKLVPINTILSVLDERHERGDAVQTTFQSRAKAAKIAPMEL